MVWETGGPEVEAYERDILLLRSVFDHPGEGREGVSACDNAKDLGSPRSLPWTIVASTGWNESALVTVYHSGL